MHLHRYALAEHDGIRLAITEADGIGRLVNLLGCDNAKARVAFGSLCTHFTSLPLSISC